MVCDILKRREIFLFCLANFMMFPLMAYNLQDGERGLGAGLRGGMLASLAAELSDSEGGYSTILDAIPHEHQRDPCASVPVR